MTEKTNIIKPTHAQIHVFTRDVKKKLNAEKNYLQSAIMGALTEKGSIVAAVGMKGMVIGAAIELLKNLATESNIDSELSQIVKKIYFPQEAVNDRPKNIIITPDIHIN